MKKTRAPKPIWTKAICDDNELPARCTVEIAALYLRCSQVMVNKWLKEGKLKGFKLGSSWRIAKEDLIAYRGDSA